MTQGNLFEHTTIVDEDMKQCGKCNQLLPVSAFSKSSGANYLRPECTECNNELGKVRDGLKLIHKPPQDNDDYNCPICKRDATLVAGKGGKAKGPWVLDHCHTSKTFRGFLCHPCNRGLGAFGDSIDTLNRAIKYIQNHKDKLNESNT